MGWRLTPARATVLASLIGATAVLLAAHPWISPTSTPNVGGENAGPAPPAPKYTRYYVTSLKADLYAEPSRSAPIKEVIDEGVPADVACQQFDGTGVLWDRLTGGQWILDTDLNTPRHDKLSSPNRSC